MRGSVRKLERDQLFGPTIPASESRDRLYEASRRLEPAGGRVRRDGRTSGRHAVRGPRLSRRRARRVPADGVVAGRRVRGARRPTRTTRASTEGASSAPTCASRRGRARCPTTSRSRASARTRAARSAASGSRRKGRSAPAASGCASGSRSTSTAAGARSARDAPRSSRRRACWPAGACRRRRRSRCRTSGAGTSGARSRAGFPATSSTSGCTRRCAPTSSGPRSGGAGFWLGGSYRRTEDDDRDVYAAHGSARLPHVARVRRRRGDVLPDALHARRCRAARRRRGTCAAAIASTPPTRSRATTCIGLTGGRLGQRIRASGYGQLPHRSFLRADVEYSLGDDFEGTRAFVEAGVRF